MFPKGKVGVSLFCPRCDREFLTWETTLEMAHLKTLKVITEHIKRVHPEYLPRWEDD